MTVKKRLFWSNILMILVPVIATALIGILCVGFIWISLINGAGLGLKDQEDFDRACLAITEVVENRLDRGADFSSLEALLDSNGMSIAILQSDQLLYSYGEKGENDSKLMSAADFLGNDATITQKGRSLYVHRESVGDQDCVICIFGGNTSEKAYANIKVALAMSVIVIAFTIFLSILLTNRFLTKFVFKKIEEPLDILTNGVHEIRDGNLDYRIVYDRQDEFQPVCEEFNEMAGKLKESVNQIQQQERSRKELVAGISHDIRSPLTSIQAYVEGLLDGIAKTPEAQQKYLETIKTKAEDLEHIVSQLFLFSKMELGEYPENLCELRLDETIVDTVSAVQEEYRQKGLLITMELEPVTMYADPVQLQRIVTNILENSLKYKSKEQCNIQISLQRMKNGCRLSFADDGPGVPQEALPHLFEVFYRSDPARQNPNQGSGLGLAIVANVVQRMGGTITALPCAPSGLEIRMDFPSEVMEHG
uniref:sensor histidine kinase n=1 Tax=Enterocloster clostridioformis TaxID=1531 RepID=UPI001C3E6BE4|nr:HAMP domain-containing sensor histidine kinase [Enterocloster clostridioformis]